ncbi:hypothetical protein [Streptomyces sp. TLI_171]|uniref:hypothetical protein n=1 Tax=Streptomyces sp. TLI_171 TaxID=1938859 RepID=UPI000C1889BB|nr:hypothetical protein [Streptomyces sp. TLI_171]RKE23547.1 hypothetical protein BX266_7021 [Streptomyces sp. TLI_171]
MSLPAGRNGWFGLLGAVAAAGLAVVLHDYAYSTHQELAWQLCLRAGTRPPRVWAAAAAAPVLGLAAAAGALRVAIRNEHRSWLVAVASMGFAVMLLVGLAEVVGSAALLFADDTDGDTCGL